MEDRERFKLLHGPYKTPRCKVGRVLFCEVNGEVVVKGYTDARIPWPVTWRRGGRPMLIVFGALAKAVRRESEIAVCHWWGVSVTTVWKWRKALDVPQVNEGTARLYRDWTPENLPPEKRERARAAANSPEANAKKSAWRKGRPIHPNALAALERHRGQRHAEETKRKIAQRNRERGIRPPAGRLWTPAQDALLGSMPDEEVARRTGRTVGSVQSRRYVLRIPLPGRNELRLGHPRKGERPRADG